MLPGPVFNVELITSARRRRYFAIRFLYGLILLLILGMNYQSMERWGALGRSSGGYTINQLSQFAIATFSSFATLQGMTILALTPALVAGAIADERQRKTLHYLMASRLNGGEIVLGKLLARLLHVGVLLAIGLPIMSLLGLFGGVDPNAVLMTYAGTATTAFFLASLSILISVVSRRARDAILVVYLLELAWLTLPPLIAFAMKSEWPILYAVVGPMNDWIYPTHPGALLSAIGPGSSSPNFVSSLAWMCGLQVAYGALFVAVAVWRLRPIFRAEGVGRRRLPRSWARRRAWRMLPRPALGDDPMLWKELHVGRFGGAARATGALVGMIVLTMLVYWMLYFAPPAFAESRSYGYGWSGTQDKRQEFNFFLRFSGTCLYCLAALGVAAAAAGGITGEKEGDTWTSLIATDLSGRDIVRGKMLGAAWAMRWTVAAMAAMWAVGLAAGAIHPFGLAAIVVETAAFLGFASALGTSLSLHSSSTTRALGWTIATLIYLNGGYLMCCAPLLAVTRSGTLLVATGCTPLIHGLSLMSYQDMANMFGLGSGYGPFRGPDQLGSVLICVLGPCLYAAGAIGLTVAAIGGFDRAVDRPDRSGQSRPPARPEPGSSSEEP